MPDVSAALPLLLALTAAPPPVPPAPPPAPPPQPLDCPLAGRGQIAVDGFLQEWTDPGAAGVRLGDGPDLTVEVRAARDGDHLFFVMGARDDVFVPTPAKEGEGGDRVRLHLADGAVLEVLLGDLEERLPSARWVAGGKGLPEARADGATRPKGWVLEIGVAEPPFWKRGWRPVGLPARVEVIDDDRDGEPTRHELPLTLRFPEGSKTRTRLLEALELPGGVPPDRELLVQLAGDPRPEWVLVYGNTLAALGEGLGEVGWSAEELPMTPHASIETLETRDVNHDGTSELVIRQRVTVPGPAGVSQEVLYLVDWTESGLATLFAIEVVNAFPKGRIESTVRFGKPKRRGDWPLIYARARKAKGIRESTYRDPDARWDAEYQPILLPWGSVRKAVYEYESGRYVRRVP